MSQSNFITEDTTIEGNVTTASSLTVAGVIDGNVNAAGEILVLPDAQINGDVNGPDVRVQGTINGRVIASGKLTIHTSGSVVGDIAVRALLIEDGGALDGMCAMGDKAKKSVSSPRPGAGAPNLGASQSGTAPVPVPGNSKKPVTAPAAGDLPPLLRG